MLRWYATNLLIPIKIRPKSNKMMERTSIFPVPPNQKSTNSKLINMYIFLSNLLYYVSVFFYSDLLIYCKIVITFWNVY